MFTRINDSKIAVIDRPSMAAGHFRCTASATWMIYGGSKIGRKKQQAPKK